MPLEVHRSFVSEEMIRNFPRPNATIFVQITANTMVRGVPVEVGDIVEVQSVDADNIIAAGRGKIVPAPEPEPGDGAALPEGQAAPKKLTKAEKKAAEAKAAAEAAEKAAADSQS